MQRLLTLVLAVVLTATASATGYAQGGGATSSIAGTVVDASGAVIPGANVVAKNNGTGAEYTTVSGQQGTFSIPALTTGTYTVTVSLMGFRTAILNDVALTAAGPATVRAVLAVGTLEETVVVEGASSIVQTQSAAVATTMDINQISNLPLTSRSALDFVVNLPGINTPGGSRDSTINGLPQSAINITIDGMSAQDNHLKTTDGFFARVSPRIDSVEEVTVSMAAQDVATTGQGAVQIRFVTRSGTNSLQGSSFYYFRHHALNANTWFNNATMPPD
ncbi:MAG: carboxypeptidase regulatory-like domain-containing protein, partial [Vicinamibacterales bacterium]